MSFFSKSNRRAARPAPPQLRVEQLEDRAVPSGAPLCHVAAAHPGGECFEHSSHAFVSSSGHDHGHHEHHHHGDGGGKHGHPTQKSGSISGTVLDTSSGNPLTGVTVTLLNSQGGLVTTATTNTSGVYTFSGLAVAGGSGSTYTVVQTTLSTYTLDTSPQTVTLTQSNQQVANVNFGNTPNSGVVIA